MRTRTKLLAGAAWFAASLAVNNFTSMVLGLPILYTAPVTEEVLRLGISEKLAPRAIPVQAAVIGAVGGGLELIWKILTMPAATVDPVYFLSFVTSLPIHVALSMAYYARRSVITNIVLHAVFNATLYGLGSHLFTKVSPSVYSASMVGFALVLCAVTILVTDRTSLQSKET
jgi:hypothetical protein